MSLHWRILVFASLFILWAELAEADESTLSVDELVQRVIVQEKADRQHQAGLEYSFTLTTEHYDASERKTSTQTVGAIAKAKANIEYSADLKTDASRTATTDEETSQRQSLRAQLDLTKLAPRFIYTIRGVAQVEGRNCWVVGYRPKAEASANSREEKVINALQGQLWIDKETLSILRCNGKIVEPVKVALIATVDPLEFSYQGQRLSNGEVVPQFFDISVTVKAPFFYTRQRQFCILSNFHTPQGG